MKSILNYEKKILIPSSVKLQKKKNNLFFSGPLGSSLINLEKLDSKGLIQINFESLPNENLVISSNSKLFLKTFYSIIQNNITGVSSGYLVSLKVVGVGYKVEIVQENLNQILYFKIGYSHDFKFTMPKSARAFLLEPTLICLYGIQENQVTEIAAKIKKVKPVSVYKGKGIRLLNEVVFLKQGKRK